MLSSSVHLSCSYFQLGNCWQPYMTLMSTTVTNTTRPIQLAIVKSVNLVTERIALQLLVEYQKELNKIVAPAIDVANYTSLRCEGLKVLVLLLKRLVQSEMKDLMQDVRQVYYLRVDEALRDPSSEVKSRADEAKHLLMD